MALNLASGPKAQLLSWVGVSGAGVLAYILAKKRTNEKKRIDMLNKTAMAQSTGSSADIQAATTAAKRGGAGSLQAREATTTSSSAAAMHFLASNDYLQADHRSTDPPLTLAQYRQKMADHLQLQGMAHEERAAA